jgi:hypothetical protein
MRTAAVALLLLALLAVPQAVQAGPYVGGCPMLSGLAGKVGAPQAFTSFSDFVAKTQPQAATLKWVAGGALCTGGAPVVLELAVPAYGVLATLLATEAAVGPGPTMQCPGETYGQFRYDAAPSWFGAVVGEGLCNPPPSAAMNAWGYYFDSVAVTWYAVWFTDQV